jgi:hypothetical protein
MRSLFSPTPQTTKSHPVPAPSLGINAVDNLALMSPAEAVYLYNLVSARYGVKVRTGYRMFAEGVDASGVLTLFPYVGSDDTKNKLFAIGQTGIYDITLGGAGPWTPVHSFSVNSFPAGYGQWTNFVNSAGNHFGLYCDEQNGYHVYEEATDTWTQVTQGSGGNEISGVDPNTFASVVPFKSRLWFVERGTANAWYLDAGALYGTATLFNFGSRFKHGGTLVNLFNWTVDGGEGIDDYLIAVSSSGDVVVFKGTDPDDADSWFQHGSWYIGPVPAGRRVGGSFGGEVYLLSQYGLLPMSKLISGTLTQQQDVYLSKKITPLVNEQMRASRTALGWEIKLVPAEQQLIVSTPKRAGFPHQQFIQSLNNDAWSIFRSIPYFTGDVFGGAFYIGAEDGNVYVYAGSVDNADLNGENGVSIEWSGLQTFQDFGEPGRNHRVQFIRPVFLGSSSPSYQVEARYDYNLTDTFGLDSSGTTSGSLWDDAIWDGAVWTGEYVVVDDTRGASGLGRAVAVGISGRSTTDITLVRYDVMMDGGGIL